MWYIASHIQLHAEAFIFQLSKLLPSASIIEQCVLWSKFILHHPQLDRPVREKENLPLLCTGVRRPSGMSTWLEIRRSWVWIPAGSLIFLWISFSLQSHTLVASLLRIHYHITMSKRYTCTLNSGDSDSLCLSGNVLHILIPSIYFDLSCCGEPCWNCFSVLIEGMDAIGNLLLAPVVAGPPRALLGTEALSFGCFLRWSSSIQSLKYSTFKLIHAHHVLPILSPFSSYSLNNFWTLPSSSYACTSWLSMLRLHYTEESASWIYPHLWILPAFSWP